MSQALAGKVALVTGAGKGMGAAIACAFAAEGATVGAMDTDAAAVTSVVEDITATGGRGIALIGDVRYADDAKRAVDAVAQPFGGVDILVNNAGVSRLGKLPEFGEEDWDFVVDINLKGMYQMARSAIPSMQARGGGAIVNIASVQAYWSQQGAVAYSASKAGVVAFTRALALDHAHEGIRVTAIAPGSVRTPMLMAAAIASAPDDPQRALDLWGKSHPIGRLIEPDEVANVAVFLASDKASAVTGVTLLVDGGLTAGAGAW